MDNTLETYKDTYSSISNDNLYDNKHLATKLPSFDQSPSHIEGGMPNGKFLFVGSVVLS